MTAAALKAEDTAPVTLAGASRAEITRALAEIGTPERELKMRAAQLWHWIYHRGARDFSAMRNIARPVLEKLAGRYTLARPEIAAEQVSADGTRKWLLRMAPAYPGDKGAEIECVYIPESDRGTLCVSSQVGCTLNCSFCHTGTMPLVRNLNAAEIVGQVLVARDRLGDFPGGIAPADGLTPKGEGVRAVSNIVFMGMGEPLYNFDAVRDAIAILADGDGLSISKRRITVSTSGVVPEMARLGAECGTMLAVSLHATSDGLRDRLVPLNRKYPLQALIEACRDYPGASNARRITFEYVMLKGVNDSASRRASAGSPPERSARQDQPHSVQSLAWKHVRMLRLGDDRALLGNRVQRRLCEPGAHAARARHSRRLRAAQERERKIARPRAHDARGEFGGWTGLRRALLPAKRSRAPTRTATPDTRQPISGQTRNR